MRARYYNSYICRFINADPSGFSGGMNFYAYADGNPISLVDPFGLCSQQSDNFFSWLGGGVNSGAERIGNSAYVSALGDELFNTWQGSQGFNIPNQISAAYQGGGGGLNGILNVQWAFDPTRQPVEAIGGYNTMQGPSYGEPLDTVDRVAAGLNTVAMAAGIGAGMNSWDAIHDDYVLWVRPGAEEIPFPVRWRNGTRIPDDFDRSTGTIFEGNTTPWSEMNERQFDRKMQQAMDDIQLVRNDPRVNRAIWFGTEPLPTTGFGGRLAQRLKDGGIPYWVVPRPH
jgi:hypothetical protein